MKVFDFLGFYFVGLGWFVVCVGVALFLGKLCYNGDNSLKNWGSILLQVICTFFCFLVCT
jgi:hypothetical protein